MDTCLKVFIAFNVIQKVLSQSRPVVNTTCLELAKSSKQQFRLTCNQHDYHCLLDETFTQEFEVCREWKWIPGGKCAYFNTYGNGNIDERKCKSGINLTCSESNHQFESKTNTKFSACYAKRESDTSLSTTTSSIRVISNGISEEDFAIPTPTSEIWIIFLLYTALLLSIFVIFFIRRYKLLCQKVKIKQDAEEHESSDNSSLLENFDSALSSLTSTLQRVSNISAEHQEVAKDELCTNEAGMEKSEDGDDTADTLKRRDLNTEEHQEVAKDELCTNEADKDKSGDGGDLADTLKRKGLNTDDSDEEWIGNEENLAKSSSRPNLHTVKYDDNDKNEKSTDAFDDTTESLLRITPITDVQAKSMCAKLFNLLDTEGLKLTQKVMTATITRETGKAVETLVNNLSDQDENKWKEALPAESYRILKSNQEHGSSFHVSYGLHRIFLDEKHHPKSGWGNPVRGTDIGIGDDIERLYRIQTIVCGISNPVTVSVESYIRLLDIMVESLTRLDIDCEFKKNYKTLSTELTYIKNQTFTQKMIKDIQYILSMW